MSSQHKLIAGTVVVAVLAGAGAALAAIELSNGAPAAATASISSDPSYGNGVVRYGLGPGRLGGRGLGGGLGPGEDDRFDAGARFAGPRLLGSTLVAAAAYLGLSTTALRAELVSGQTLAQIARVQGESVDGLVAAMVSAARQAIDTAVGNGYLTQQQAAAIEAGMAARLKGFVRGTWSRGPFGGGFGADATGFPAQSGTGSFGGETTTTTT